MTEPQAHRIGRYEILSKVGQGAMGIVYRAQDPTIRRVVALKVLRADSADAAREGSHGHSPAGSFEREAQAAGALLHPNIVTLYDAGRDGNWYYLAMEFVQGETFAAEIARSGKVGPMRAAEVIAAVADALDFAHERGVVHRDIKPANLMILGDQRVKVADFGIARLTSATTTMTSDLMVGTPHYMSPEQVRGGEIDGRSDLFSLGVVLYEALTGRKPFQAETLPAVLNAILNATPPSPHEVDPAIPAELSKIVMRAMANKRDGRYARGKDMAADLRRFVGTRAAPGASTAGGTRREATWRVTVAGTVLAVLLLGLGWVVFLRDQGEKGAAPQFGYLELVSDPAGADVFLDGNVVGRTPYTAEVSAGQHEVEFRKQGYYPATQSPTVEPNKRVVVELPMIARREG